MTSRLKRKLDNIGIDPSSSKLTESFCLIGTPLPPLEKAKDQNEFVPVWKQDVRDEQGRRRLHGAFTGGFSAGYFNSVGSKEGWTPSTFKSSREARASTSKAARPEDFMDEEDLEELRNSKIIVDKTEEMDLLGGTQGELSRRAGAALPDDDPIANAVANTLLPPSSDSAGAKLLRKMGWRPGQGVGPRVSYDQLRKQDLQSSDLPVSAKTQEMDQDDEAQKHTFAPRDTKVIIFRPKENHSGLGYVPGASLSEANSHREASGPSLSAGFGLGALNDAEDDDVDVYDSAAPHRSSRAVAYDAYDSGEKVTLGSKRQTAEYQQPLGERRQIDKSYTFHDGRPVLSGFMLSDQPVAEDTWFKLPDVPKGWKPDPYRVWSSSSSAPTDPVPSAAAPGRPDVSRFKATGRTLAEERGAKLGEAGFPDQKPRSIFDYLSEKDRARLQNLAGKSPNDPSPTSDDQQTPSHTTSAPTPTIAIPTIDSPVAQAALRGYQPFITNPEKQARYTAYLKSQTVPSGASSERSALPAQRQGQTIDEYNHELQEYAKSAMIFKPMSGAMANRFTSAAIIESGPKIQEGLHMPAPSSATDPKSGSASDSGAPSRMEVEETPKQHAARMGMHGPLTREVQVWAPARLLCKRFGVKDPRPDPAVPPGDADLAGASTKSNWEEPTATPETSLITQPDAPVTRSGPKDISNIGLGEDDDQGRDTLTYQRPAMDIFKAIFASDDEDSDDDEEGDSKPPATLPAISIASDGAPPVVSTANAESETLPDEGPVDLASFKPKFVPKSHRDRDEKSNNDGSSKKSKSNSRSKAEGKVKKSLVSFGMDEEGEDGGLSLSVVPDLKSSKKKKKDREKKRRRDEDPDSVDAKRPRSTVDTALKEDAKDEEDEWIEKSPPKSSAQLPVQSHDVEPRRLARPRASDFM